MSNTPLEENRSSLGRRYIAFVDKVSELSGTVAAYLLVPLVIVFLIEIIARNVFNHPTTWAYGTCFIIGGCAAVLGFGYAMKNGAMVRIDILYQRLGTKHKCILDLIMYTLIFLPVAIGGAYMCTIYAISSVSVGEMISVGSWNAPIWPTKIVMAISMIILTMQGTAEMVQDVLTLKELKQEEK